MKRRVLLTVVLVVVWSGFASAQVVITKPPDLGDTWQPLSPDGGTYVYADSFELTGPDAAPTELGTWLLEVTAPAPPVRFEIWGEAVGGGPDAGNVLATTGTLSPAADGTLTFFSAPVIGTPAVLSSGTRYWFAATVVGESGTGEYRLGGHTQNSVYVDNGTFWYSNDPAGVSFDGQNLTPEIAFEVTLGASTAGIPTLGTWGVALMAMLLASAGVLAVRRLAVG